MTVPMGAGGVETVAPPLDFAVPSDTNAIRLAQGGAMDRWQDEFWCRFKEALRCWPKGC